MFHPPGFQQNSMTTSLGQMVYYEAVSPLEPEEPPIHRPILLFLHGFGGGSSAYEWSKVYPAFAHDYRVVAPDLLGWGRSDHPLRDYRIGDYLVTLQEFMEQVCQPPTTVVASSLTAALIVRLAIAQPRLFRTLILFAPSGLSDFGKAYGNPLSQLVGLPILDQWIYHSLIATSSSIRGFMEQTQFARSSRVSGEMVEAYLASAIQPNAAYSALAFVRGNLCFDLADYVPQLRIPTAIAWGNQAKFTPYKLGVKLADLNPKAIRIFKLFEDVGLTPQLEMPALAIAFIQQCLKRLA
jgi:pimeloyl-ACP methyl ester carboxylesterase